MMTLHVENMTCGHCVKSITNAIKEADENVVLDFDLASKQVKIESVLDAIKVISILEEEGYHTKVLG